MTPMTQCAAAFFLLMTCGLLACGPAPESASIADPPRTSDKREDAQTGEAFEPKCRPEGYYRDLPFKYSTLTHLPQRPGPVGSYANRIFHPRHFIANQHVALVEFVFDDFDLESCCDHFAVRLNKTPLQGYAGNLGAFTSQTFLFWPGELANPGLEHLFSTDSSGTRRGYSIDKMHVGCSTNSASVSPVEIKHLIPHDGLLVEQDDAVYFKITGRHDHNLAVLLDGTGGDFDLYLRKGSLPTRVEWDYYSARTGPQEAVYVDEPLGGQTLFGVVYSKIGGGRFTLTAHHILLSNAKTVKVGFRFRPTQSEVESAETYLRAGFRQFFAMSEGLVHARSIELFNDQTLDGDCSCGFLDYCDICLTSNVDDNARAFCFAGRMVIPALRWAVQNRTFTVAHEAGHCWLDLDDEYEDHCGSSSFDRHSDSKCVRSMMGGDDLALNVGNLCHDSSHRVGTAPVGHVCQTCSNSSCSSAPGARDCGTCAAGHTLGVPGGNPPDSAWYTFPPSAAAEYVDYDTDGRDFLGFSPLDDVLQVHRNFVPEPDQ